MSVAFAAVAQEAAEISKDVHSALDRLISTGSFICGQALTDFEADLASACGSRYAVGVSSGTDGLLASLLALEVGSGDEVITTPFTFVSTVEVIARVGATAVFVDVDTTSWTLDPTLVKAAITAKTKAIIPVNLFGYPCQLPEDIGVPVIEDSAQSFGLAPRGLAACLSFFPSKILGGFGDGGAVLTSDEVLADKLRSLRQHGKGPDGSFESLGGNFRLDALQAAVLQAKLRRIDGWLENRKQAAHYYHELLDGNPVGLEPLAKHPEHRYNYFVVKSPDRDTTIERLGQAGIETKVYYRRCVHQEPVCRGHYRAATTLTNAENAAKHGLALPMHSFLTRRDVEQVVAALQK